ncbi:MAG: GerMN domain-containing protein [Negativicutes bacterium]|nr:GerMN domain-containing protein [Negativicutes bacterium]
MKSNKLWPVALLLILLMIAGCAGNVPASQGADHSDPAKNAGNSQPVAGQTEKMKITVYHATKDAMYLVPEVHEVERNNHPAQTALELLLAPPKSSDLVAVLPQGTKVRGISVKDHIAQVDFSSAIVKNNAGGSATEMLAVGAIVNTLTEFPDIHKVQILIEGKKVETLTGHMDVSEPLSRAEKIIKK